jgi:hypothetical protein
MCEYHGFLYVSIFKFICTNSYQQKVTERVSRVPFLLPRLAKLRAVPGYKRKGPTPNVIDFPSTSCPLARVCPLPALRDLACLSFHQVNTT